MKRLYGTKLQITQPKDISRCVRVGDLLEVFVKPDMYATPAVNSPSGVGFNGSTVMTIDEFVRIPKLQKTGLSNDEKKHLLISKQYDCTLENHFQFCNALEEINWSHVPNVIAGYAQNLQHNLLCINGALNLNRTTFVPTPIGSDFSYYLVFRFDQIAAVKIYAHHDIKQD